MKLLIALLLAGMATAAGRLSIYFIDVEGGQATLIVAPTGESMLIDAGWEERDALRIQKAMHAAGLTRINFLLLTHYHRDHAGGIAALAKLVPIVTYLDHGPNTENYAGSDEIVAAYAAVSKGRRRAIYPGDELSVGDAHVNVLIANGQRLTSPLDGAGLINPYCGTEKPQPMDKNENTQSIGIVVTFGNFRILDLGDILWNQEMDLVCPVNRIGTVDVYLATHHGTKTSGAGTLVRVVHPRVAVLDNAPEKGGAPETFHILKESPGLQAIWQLHTSTAAGQLNSPEPFIANPGATDAGLGLVLSAAPNGEFSILNERTGKTEAYPAKR
jgi:competence protein ComEC